MSWYKKANGRRKKYSWGNGGGEKGGDILDMKLKWNEGSWDDERDKGGEEARREDSKRKISKYKISMKML